jgi:hypothetical protein
MYKFTFLPNVLDVLVFSFLYKFYGHSYRQHDVSTVLIFEHYLSVPLQSFVRPWALFQFLNPVHSRYVVLDGESALSQDRYLRTEHENRIDARARAHTHGHTHTSVP